MTSATTAGAVDCLAHTCLTQVFQCLRLAEILAVEADSADEFTLPRELPGGAEHSCRDLLTLWGAAATVLCQPPAHGATQPRLPLGELLGRGCRLYPKSCLAALDNRNKAAETQGLAVPPSK